MINIHNRTRERLIKKLEKKVVSGIMLTLLLTSILTLAFNIQPVKASGTIYIKSDGSVDPSTAPIQRDGNVYIFTGDINGSTIVVEKNNILVDGAGHILRGPGANLLWDSVDPGVYLHGRGNVTIKNIEIKAFQFGIWLNVSSNNNILKNNITNNYDRGISFSESSDNTLSDNYIANNAKWGVYLLESSNNLFRNNSMVGNRYNFGAGGHIQDLDASNMVDGKPMYYWVNRQDMKIPSDAGYVRLVNCKNITIEGLELKNNGEGIVLVNTTNSHVRNNNVTRNYSGIWLEKSSYNILVGNNLKNNEDGISLSFYSSFNSVSNNTITSSFFIGISLNWGSSNNTLYSNVITNGWGDGVHIDGPLSYDNTLYGNTITDNLEDGVTLDTRRTNFIGNTVARNGRQYGFDYGGIHILNEGNFIFHNNFIDNDPQVRKSGMIFVNTWDNGYPSGGNYWSDYTGVDANGDGIGDTPYIIDLTNIGVINQDRYPLMAPYVIRTTLTFDPARDSFSFVNKGFGGFGLDENVMSFLEVADFVINDPIYRLIDVALPGSTLVLIPLVYSYLRSYHEDILNGHCYGMSYLVARWFNHPTERPGYPDSTVHSLQLDDELHRLIDNAQQSQLLDFYTFVRWFFVTKESFSWSNLNEYQTIKSIVQTGAPTVMGIADKANKFYHAVVVYRIESAESIDTLYISDPNKDIETYSFDTTKDNLGINFRIMAMGVTDQELFNKFVEWLIDSLTFWVHSPVDLHIYDSAGHHVGVDASGKVEIGFEATFLKADDSQLVFISKPSNKYTVKLVGIGTGAYNLTAYRAADDRILSAVKTGTVTEGKTIEYEATVAKDDLTLQIPGLAISWLTWAIFGAFIAVGIGAVVKILSVTRKHKLKKMPQAEEKKVS